MIVAMLLAHLVGDYIFQWDGLANWKSRAIQGVLVHGAIVSSVTILMALLIDAGWWPWAVFIGVTHTVIDAGWLWVNRRVKIRSGRYPIVRLMIDQTLHLSVIALTLFLSGSIDSRGLIGQLATAFTTQRTLVIFSAYAFVMMPAWILIEFAAYGLINGSAPDFSVAAKNKYVGSLERGLMLTFVLLGQVALVPMVVLPRLIFDTPHVIGQPRATIYAAEWLASVAVAVLIGVGLKAAIRF